MTTDPTPERDSQCRDGVGIGTCGARPADSYATPASHSSQRDLRPGQEIGDRGPERLAFGSAAASAGRPGGRATGDPMLYPPVGAGEAERMEPSADTACGEQEQLR